MALNQTWFTHDSDETVALAQRIALAFKATLLPLPGVGFRIDLRGELGAGKTCWTRAFIQALGYPGKVRSPSYTLLEHYNIKMDEGFLPICHLDLYRFHHPNEWDSAGFDEAILNTLTLIEWPERAAGKIARADLELNFEYASIGRKVSANFYNDPAKQLCLALGDD